MVLGHRLFVVTRHRLGRLAEAPQIWRDHRVILCQLNHQWPPHVTVLSVAVQKNNWVALTSDQIVKSDGADGCEAMLNRRSRLGPNGRGYC
jgi:hypothetical protein